MMNRSIDNPINRRSVLCCQLQQTKKNRSSTPLKNRISHTMLEGSAIESACGINCFAFFFCGGGFFFSSWVVPVQTWQEIYRKEKLLPSCNLATSQNEPRDSMRGCGGVIFQFLGCQCKTRQEIYRKEKPLQSRKIFWHIAWDQLFIVSQRERNA